MIYFCACVCSEVSETQSPTSRTIHLSTSMPAAGHVPPTSLQLSTAFARPLLHTVSNLQQQPLPTLPMKTVPPRHHVSQSPRQSVVDDGRRTIAKVPPPDSDSEDEVEVIQAFYGRPTRSGRIPRPAIRPSEDDIEQFTSITEPLKSSASTSFSSSQTDLAASLSTTNVAEMAINQPKRVVILPQLQARQTCSLTPQLVRHTTSLPQSSAVSIHATSQNSITSSVSATASSKPPMDLSHLPPGYFVVVEVPSSSSADVSGGQQRALYHIFAVDEGVAESSTLPAVSTDPQYVTESSTLPAVTVGQPYISTAVCQQSSTLSSANTVYQTAVCNQPVTVGHSGEVRSGSNVQLASQSVVHSESQHTAASNVPQHTGSSLFTEEQSSSTLDVAQICEDLSGLIECELTAMKQGDGTVVIQTTPVPNRLPPPRPLAPPVMLPRPALQMVPRQTSMKLVPHFPPSPQFAQMVTHGQPYSANIVLDTDCGASSDVTGEAEDGTQYVDIVVEDCDNFEREEYIV